jgi:hypothetical protein
MKQIPLFAALLLIVGCGPPVKRCLVSPLWGRIVSNGVPVVGATVTRKYYSHWYKEQVENVTHTDAGGYFDFDGAWKKAIADLLHQPVIEEKIVIESQGKVYTVLDVTKMDYDKFGELEHVQSEKAAPGKERLLNQDGKLYLRFDLALNNVPIGRRPPSATDTFYAVWSGEDVPVAERCAAVNARFTNGTRIRDVLAVLGPQDAMIVSTNLSLPAESQYQSTWVFRFGSEKVLINSTNGNVDPTTLSQTRLFTGATVGKKQ